MLSRLKRNFSIIDSPSKRERSFIRTSPAFHGSPLKRVRLGESFLTSTFNPETTSNCSGGNGLSLQVRDNSPIKPAAPKEASSSKVTFEAEPVIIETPPATPACGESRESKMAVLLAEKSNLEQQSQDLDAKFQEKFETLKGIRSQIIGLSKERLTLEDKVSIANEAQLTLRNSLNSIYNPSQELVKSVKVLINDCKRGHSKKLEKLTFELNDLLETSMEAINEQTTHYQHEFELHQRSMETFQREEEEKAKAMQKEGEERELEEQEERAQRSTSCEAKDQDNSVQDVSARVESLNDEGLKPDAMDDDCVILEESAHSNIGENSPNRSADYVDENSESITKGDNQAVDDDSTDVDTGAEDDERGFTPLQAQRPVQD